MTVQAKTLQVCESLIREHRRMEGLLEQLGLYNTDLNIQQPETLQNFQNILGQIETDMNTHFACEEKVLFPAVSPYHSMVLMEVEHEELIALRDQLLKLDMETPDSVSRMQTLVRQFIEEMLDHIGREDAGIFPVCEKSLNDEEKRQVIAGMQKIRDAAQTIPTPSIDRPERTFASYQANLSMPISRDVFSQRLGAQDGLEIKEIMIQCGKSLTAHWSPKEITLICLKGNGIFSGQGQETALSVGTCLILQPQLLHRIDAHSDCVLLLLLREAA